MEQTYNIVAELIVLLALAVIFCWRLRGKRANTTYAFLCGICVGIATLLCYWAAIAIVVLLILVFGIFKVYSRKAFWSIIFGFLTPLWLYLPYYLYKVLKIYNFPFSIFPLND